MQEFLVKSILCQAVLFGLYYLILEREKMHRFNRFFLLFSLVFSFVIPFVTIEFYQEVTVLPVKNEIVFEENPITSPAVFVEQSTDYLPLFLWSIYGLVTFVLSIRFAKNLHQIKNRIKSNSREKIGRATLVLVPEKILPHTFLNYIFINKDDHKNKQIEEELYTHELTHSQQNHTLDILFIEILKTVFWFNPILILYKKAIQLNHEFLADENVVATYNVTFYQSLLLEKASWNSNFQLVSNLNFLVTKKRLIMMTKTTSRNTATLKKLFLAPLFCGIIYFTCTKTVAQEKNTTIQKTKTAKTSNNNNKEERRAKYFAGVRFVAYEKGTETKNNIVGRNIVFDKLYEEFTPEDKELWEVWLYTQDGYKKNSPTQKEFEDFKNIKKYAIWIDGKNVSNSELSKLKTSDIAYFSGSVILKNARTKKHPQPFQYWLYTHAYFDKNEMGKPVEKYPGDKKEIFISVSKDKNLKKTASHTTQKTKNLDIQA